jgi:hypothetical protein
MIVWNRGNQMTRVLSLFLVICCVPWTSLAAPGWQGVIGVEDNLPLVSNPGHPISGDETITPKELWRLGGEDEEQDVIFGLIGDALVDDQDNTYLLDTILSTIHKVAPDGTILTSIGREGDGPGELRNSRTMTFMPGGGIGVMEMMSGRIVVLGLDGNPKSDFAPAGGGNSAMTLMQRCVANEQSVVVGQISTDFEEGKVTTNYTLGRFTPEGELQGYLFKDAQEQSGGNISLSFGSNDSDFTSHWTLCPDGRIVVFQQNKEYKLEVFDATGSPTMIIRREYEPVRRSDEAIARDKKRQESMAERFGGHTDMQVEEFARDISEAIARPNGDLWVKNSQGDDDCPEQSLGYFDVFNSAGHYVKRVRIEADYDPQRDNFSIRDNKLYVFKEAQKAPDRTSTSGGGGMTMVMISGSGANEDDEDDEALPFEVVCYQLPRE